MGAKETRSRRSLFCMLAAILSCALFMSCSMPFLAFGSENETRSGSVESNGKQSVDSANASGPVSNNNDVSAANEAGSTTSNNDLPSSLSSIRLYEHLGMEILGYVFGEEAIRPGNASQEITTGPLAIARDKKTGGVYLGISYQDFNNLGFKLGDSLDIAFSNGVQISDVPYFSDYFVASGSYIVRGSSSSGTVLVSHWQDFSFWEEVASQPETTATVSLHHAGKYLKVQNALHVAYSGKRADYDTDTQFANFRELSGGALKPNLFYRSASPIHNTEERTKAADTLAKQHGISYVINLSDTPSKVTELLERDYNRNSYYKTLVEASKVNANELTVDATAEATRRSVATMLVDACNHEGPYLVHCVEGRVRTGFTCALVLALAGADYQSILDDYMVSYANFMGITPQTDPLGYLSIYLTYGTVFPNYLDAIDGDSAGCNLKEGARNYLRLGGLTDEEIAFIEARITR